MKTIIENNYLTNETKLLKNKEAAFLLYVLHTKGIMTAEELEQFLGLPLEDFEVPLSKLFDYGMVETDGKLITATERGIDFLLAIELIEARETVSRTSIPAELWTENVEVKIYHQGKVTTFRIGVPSWQGFSYSQEIKDVDRMVSVHGSKCGVDTSHAAAA